MKAGATFFTFLAGLVILITIISFKWFRERAGPDGDFLSTFPRYNGTTHTNVKVDLIASAGKIEHSSKFSLIERNNSTFYQALSHESVEGNVVKSISSKDTDRLRLKASMLSVGSCPYDFKVYVYGIPGDLPSVRLGREARTNSSLHVCQKCSQCDKVVLFPKSEYNRL